MSSSKSFRVLALASTTWSRRHEEFARDLNVLERMQANHEEMNFHFSRPHTALSVLLLNEIDPMS